MTLALARDTIELVRALVVIALVATTAHADVTADAIAKRFAADPKAQKLAVELYAATEDVADVGADEIMEGGYRGKIHLVPELPIRGYRPHLQWVATAMTGIDAWFAQLFPDPQVKPAYRWRQITFHFVRSVGKHTPSAYTSGWNVVYNVAGSLLTGEPGVRETLFHELFHANDGEHHDWSKRTLARDYDAIVGKCKTAIKCLAPYAPNVTVVRGGTYYAFQPNNGETVHEYGAELAVRYWKEQTEMLARKKLSRPAFKCGPAENARAWQALVDEFFAGRDLVPAC